ncbi:glycoside hydrolase family 3 C-terminal domain-containing protein [Lacticaseibacillus pantheris]
MTKLTPQQQINLTSGHDFWTTESVPGIPSIRFSDGPHGLRFQDAAADHLGLNASVPATAFPTASAAANTWDPELLRAMGAAIGEEARRYNIDVVLGPGINVKRSPLGGRNFEYFSEDPLLAGAMGAAWIRGLQSTGTGASLKHFAGNSQERDRLRYDALIDPVTLHEVYLEAFRLAVTQAQPETVMTAYNQVNGHFMSDHRYLIDTVLRQQWGFKGAVVTDWGGLNDKVAAINAGTDIEMPSSNHIFDAEANRALAQGQLQQDRLDATTTRISALANRQRPAGTTDPEAMMAAHHALAQRIEEHAAVLLQNRDDALPLNPADSLLLVGDLAEHTRYQGAGSSHINATPTSILAGLDEQHHAYNFVRGYELGSEQHDAQLVAAATEAAMDATTTVVVAGLPSTAESEGFDRENLNLPDNQNALIAALAPVTQRLIVVLVGGAPVSMPWADKVDGIIQLYLGGEAVGTAASRILFGDVNPSGKLAETYPLHAADVPAAPYFSQPGALAIPYAESLYVGYRYYDKAQVPVAFPFGFGLSYTNFTLNHGTIDATSATDDALDRTVTITVANQGERRGAETVQIYVGQTDQAQLAPVKALAAFKKVWLEPHEEDTLTIDIPARAFMRWDENHQKFRAVPGDWRVFVGTSSTDIVADFTVTVGAPAWVQPDVPAWYRQPQGHATVADFTALSGMTVTPTHPEHRGEHTRMSTPRTLGRHSRVARKVADVVLQQLIKNDNAAPGSPEERFFILSVLDSPIIRLAQQSGGALKLWQVDALVWLANRRILHRRED